MFESEGQFYALDSFREPGHSSLVSLSNEDVEAHLMNTWNAIFALWK